MHICGLVRHVFVVGVDVKFCMRMRERESVCVCVCVCACMCGWS